MADIVTNTLQIGNNNLILRDADAQEQITDLKEEISQLSGLSEDVKLALLQIAQKVVYVDDEGQDYYDDLYNALYPPVPLASISAVYTQSGTVYDTDSLDSLKSDLVVTATYEDSTTETVTDYTLSGTLAVGTSTITVAYGGKTTTFTVTVSATPTLSSISAVYTQSGTVYTSDSLDMLKSDLVVTATYSDQTTETVTTYTLSGTLTVGTSTITVSYGGMTDTFTVTVSQASSYLYNWDFTKSLIDTVNGVTAITNGTTSETGITIDGINQYIALTPGITMSMAGKAVEIDIASMSDITTAAHSRLFNVTTNTSYATNNNSDSFLLRQSPTNWYIYNGSWSSNYISGSDYPGSYFSGKTLKIEYDSDGYPTVSVNGTELLTYTSACTKTGQLIIGGNNSDYLYRMSPTISGVRIYAV